METTNRGTGWLAYSAVVLFIGGVFALIDGLVAVYKSTFFTQNAVYVFSDLNTWGWIIFGLGVAGVVSGLAVISGREWARWLGVLAASLGAVGQLLFAQAFPLWSLMITGVYVLALYGLLARWDDAKIATSSRSSMGSGDSSQDADVHDLQGATRRAA
jgi:hypothetical protein